MASDVQTEVGRLADEAIGMLQDRAEGLLDFSPASLHVVEEILEEASRFRDELPEAQITAITQRVGCYILEIAHRQFGGQFFWHQDLGAPILVTGEPKKHVALATWAKVRSRIAGDLGDNLPFFYEGFAARAATAPAGTHALYV
ncbi:hypothetical protein ACFFGH_32345 [Lysobacter korlensis]|uniref:GAF domain-containing protein n=1 Tax=Lysobacter korlensis TaxID=553636 RepID=A0ABV6S0I0_9GAMM